MKTAHPQIINVIGEDLCIACGACIVACPKDNIRPNYDEKRGAPEVMIADPCLCIDCPAPCDLVCPGIRVDFRKLLNVDPVEPIGPIAKVYTGYSPQFQQNGISSSGGIVRAIIFDALENGTPVICLGKKGNSFAPILFDDPRRMDEIPGSIYHGVSFVEAIPLLQAAPQPCVLIGISCQLEGIFNYIDQVEPDLRRQIKLTVGIICGWMYSDHALHAFMRFKKMAEKALCVRYRGDDKVGLLTIWTEHRQYQFSRRQFANRAEEIDYKSSFSRTLNRLRCRACENHVNVLADMAVGDAWLARKKTEKLSIIVTRTTIGDKTLRELEARQTVRLEPATLADLHESQSTDFIEGGSARKFNRMLATVGYHPPRFIFGQIISAELSRSDRINFRIEMGLRKIIQRRYYGLYRFLYVMRRYSTSVLKRIFRF